MEKQYEMQYNTATNRQIGFFALNNTATNIYLFMFIFVVYYATGIAGLGVVLVGTITTAMRMWDGVTDPIIGFLIDRTETKFGKFRPFMIVGNIMLAIMMLIIVQTTHLVPESMRVLYFIGMYALYIIGYTFQTACTRAAQTVLTNSPKQRPMFSLFDAIYNTILFTGGQFFISEYLAPKHGGFTMGFFNELLMYGIALGMVFTLLSVSSIWNKDIKEYWGAGDVVRTKFKDYWPILKGNRAMQMLVVSAATDKLAAQVRMQAPVVVMVYGVLMGNYALSGRVGLITVLPTVLVTFAGIDYAKRLGIKKAYVLATILSIVFWGALGLFMMVADLTTISISGGLNVNTLIYLGLLTLGMAVAAVGGNIVIPMIADCADYETYKSHRYVPGMMATIFSFVDKMVSAFAATVVALAVATIGFTDVLPQIDDVATPQLKAITIFLFVGVPILGWLASLVAMKFYPLNGTKMEEVQHELNARRAAVNE